MGFLDALFGGGKEEKASQPEPQHRVPAGPAPAAPVAAPGISQEVVAAIAAAVYAMTGTGNLAIRIRHVSNTWTVTGRQQLMDSRQLA